MFSIVFTELSISIHTPHAGSDSCVQCLFFFLNHFNPHSPCGERPPCGVMPFTLQNFNPHSPCGERLAYSLAPLSNSLISIHTPHAGSDAVDWLEMMRREKFQSTLPMLGATTVRVICFISTIYFNPHSPCGERPPLPVATARSLKISIHTPHAGSDFYHTGRH